MSTWHPEPFTSVFSRVALARKLGVLADLAKSRGFEVSPILDSAGDRFGLYSPFLSPWVLRRNPEAKSVLLVISGTHGVEGPVGIDLQTDLLLSGLLEKVLPEAGVVMIAPLNPFGYIDGRRVNDEGVDLNRNGWFGDQPPVTPPIEAEIERLVNPDVCDQKWYDGLRQLLGDPSRVAEMRRQVFLGQYTNPEGIFFGGRERAPELRELELFLTSLQSTCRELVVIDIHSGLGNFGEILWISSDDSESPAGKRARSNLLGSNQEPRLVFPNSGAVPEVDRVSFDLLTFIIRCLPETQVTALAAEIGTYSFQASFPAFVMEHVVFRRQKSRGLVCVPGKIYAYSAEMAVTDFQRHFYPLVEDTPASRLWFALARENFLAGISALIRQLIH